MKCVHTRETQSACFCYCFGSQENACFLSPVFYQLFGQSSKSGAAKKRRRKEEKKEKREILILVPFCVFQPPILFLVGDVFVVYKCPNL